MPGQEIVAKRDNPFWQQKLESLAKLTGLSLMTLSRARRGIPVSATTVASVLAKSTHRFEELWQVQSQRGPEFKVPEGFKLVPVDDDDPALVDDAPVKVPDDDGDPLPVTFKDALADSRFQSDRIKIDPSMPDDDEDEDLYATAAVLREGETPLYAVESDGTIHAYRAVLDRHGWAVLAIRALVNRFGLTDDEVRDLIRRDGIFTEGRAMLVVSGRN